MSLQATIKTKILIIGITMTINNKHMNDYKKPRTSAIEL